MRASIIVKSLLLLLSVPTAPAVLLPMHGRAFAAPPESAGVKQLPPLVVRCKDNTPRGVQEQGTELWGIRSVTVGSVDAPPVFQRVSLDGAQLSDGRPAKLALRGGHLVPAESVGALPAAGGGAGTVERDPLVGAVVNASAPNGSSIELTICEAIQDPKEPELYRYRVQYYDTAWKRWMSACPSYPGKMGTYAIPISGVWESSGLRREVPGQFTFACPAGVLTKCVDWGYKPWKTQNGRSLAEYHQACTRMARADYCGQGKSHTETGHKVDVYDDLGIMKPEPTGANVFEAAWTPDGAYCLARTRLDTPISDISKECPGRFVSGAGTPLRADETCNLQRPSPASILIRNRSQVVQH